MKINLKKAVKTFYPNPSFEQVYLEAVANAIDAGAKSIAVDIKIESYDKPETLSIRISDDGSGFNDLNFKKFSSLLEVESNDHKGLGRLVYLAYFDHILINSQFTQNLHRSFVFNADFKGECIPVEKKATSIGTSILFSKFSGEKVKSYAYLTPSKIKETILDHFFPLFFTKKEAGGFLNITINLEVINSNIDKEFVSGSISFDLSDLPILEKSSITDSSIDFFHHIDIYYSVKNDFSLNKSIKASICVDGRAIDWDLLSIDSVPNSHQLVFLFLSDYFKGKTNSSRQKLELPDSITEKTLRTVLRSEIGKIIREKIPSIVDSNKTTMDTLEAKYPHLNGYYPKDEPGLVVISESIEEAKNAFFSDQKKILECESLDETKYVKALELSARALMEYVIYRTKIIAKLKSINPLNSEAEIHKLIVPMKKELKSGKFIEDIYNNNIWILDDKYMSYNTIVSDLPMGDVTNAITSESISDEGRPDITIVFSGNPNLDAKVSVVVVELKKKSVPLAKKEEVISQLKQRARRLLQYYPHKIERIWFYGITDIDKEFRYSLKEEQFKELFSHGQLFYKQQSVIVNDEDSPFNVDMFILNYEAFIHDAESRNFTFMKILTDRISSFIKQDSQNQTEVVKK